MSWIQTYTGKRFDVLTPRAEDVCIEDIAHALANICRFTGHTRAFYSVAQHSVYAAQLAEPVDKLYALLHDASEAYLCDIARPVKRLALMDGYRVLEHYIQSAVYEQFGLSLLNKPAAIKILDDRLLATEAAQLFGPLLEDWTGALGEPFPLQIQPWAPRTAERHFLEAYARHRLSDLSRA